MKRKLTFGEFCGVIALIVLIVAILPGPSSEPSRIDWNGYGGLYMVLAFVLIGLIWTGALRLRRH